MNCHLTPAQLLKIRDNAIWAVNAALENGLKDLAKKYLLIQVRIENTIIRKDILIVEETI